MEADTGAAVQMGSFCCVSITLAMETLFEA